MMRWGLGDVPLHEEFERAFVIRPRDTVCHELIVRDSIPESSLSELSTIDGIVVVFVVRDVELLRRKGALVNQEKREA